VSRSTLEQPPATRAASDGANTALQPIRAKLASPSGGAIALALATAAQNVLGLAFTLIFARWLGASGYASLAVLVSAFLVLSVPGTALQVAVARRLGRATSLAHAAAGRRRAESDAARVVASAWPWIRAVALATAICGGVGLAAREPLAGSLAIDEPWAAGLLPATAAAWALLCVARGAWQALGRYRLVAASIVADATLRICAGVVLVAGGLGVAGAFAASVASFLVVAAVLIFRLRGTAPPRAAASAQPSIGRLVSESAVPMAALGILLAMQEIHVIFAKHLNADRIAGGYAAVAVAAKTIVWVAVGLAMYTVPEAARRSAAGRDPRVAALHALAILGLCSLGMVAIFAIAGRTVIRAAFGEELTAAVSALAPLGAAMSGLAVAYVLAQYHVALGRRLPLAVLACALLVELAVCAAFGQDPQLLAWGLAAVFSGAATVLAAYGFAPLPAGTDAHPAAPVVAVATRVDAATAVGHADARDQAQEQATRR